MHWINDEMGGKSRVLPPITQNEVELVVTNFKERYINTISRLLEYDGKCDEIRGYHNITLYSDWNEMPNFLFRLMFFPVCPHSDGGSDLSQFKISAYVEAARKSDWPENWICYGTKFCIIVINQIDIQSSIFKRDTFNFSKTDSDRGWQGILSHIQILENGFLTDGGDLVIRAGVYPTGAEVDRSIRDGSYNCRESTGFVGLQNHGATCYMNALLQSLYSITKFRRSVYKLSFGMDQLMGPRSYEIVKRFENDISCIYNRTNKRKSDYNNVYMELDNDLSDCLDEKDCYYLLMEEEEEKRRNPSVGLALQNLFYNLSYSDDALPCKELMRSFGWDSSDMFTQQDSHELLKLLLDKMEEQMKGTLVEGSVKNIFEGEMETYIECIDIEYKSCRRETFEDIQLDVQGCNNIYESLDKLIEPEILSGDNMYEAKGYGKQRANKGIRFIKFPPVCIFLLKRFTFDLQRMDTVKLNNRFEFYKEIDLNKYCRDSGKYILQAVSVHHGSINSGHYYTFTLYNNHWYKFDDEIVTSVSEYAAIGDNFGGEDLDCINYLTPLNINNKLRRPKAYNAYILIYVLKSSINDILGECNILIENKELIKRIKLQETLQKLRKKIHEKLNKYIKIKLYNKLDYINNKFINLPYINYCGGKLLTFDKNKNINDVLYELNNDKLYYNYHIMGINKKLIDIIVYII